MHYVYTLLDSQEASDVLHGVSLKLCAGAIKKEGGGGGGPTTYVDFNILDGVCELAGASKLHALSISTSTPLYHARVSSKGGGGGGGRRGSFPPKQLNFPPKLTQLPPQDIANNYNYEVYPPFTVALQPHDP